MKVIGDTLWILTNQLQNFIAGTGRATDVKYRVLVGSVSSLIHGTGCDTRSGGYSVNELGNVKLSFDSERFPSETRPLYFIPTVPEASSYSRVPLFQQNRASPLTFNFVPNARSWQKTFKLPQWRETFLNFS